VEERPEPPARKPAGLLNSVEAEPEPKSKKVWIFAGAGAVVLAIAGAAIAMHSSKPPVQTVTVVNPSAQPSTTTPQSQPADAGQTPQASGKPSAATALATTPGAPLAEDSKTPATPAPVRPDMMNSQLNAPSRISASARNVNGDAPPSETFGSGLDSGGGTSGIGSLSKQTGVKVQLDAAKSKSVSGGVTGGTLIQKTSPVYPAIAKQARITGTVTMQVTITKAGTVTGVHVISGPTALQQAAMDAVRNWRYKPFMLNNQPVEVQQSLSVNFQLGAN
jgi:protein TonB